jgi:hypothetical protein
MLTDEQKQTVLATACIAVLVFVAFFASYSNGSAPSQEGTKVTDTLIAVFTAALFVATVLFTTRKLVIGSEDTAKRQLRAYVHVDTTSFAPLTGRPGKRVLVTLTNFGLTPAYCVEMFFCVKVIAENERTFPEAPRERGKSIIAPGKTEKLLQEISLDGPTHTEIVESRAALYAWGKILYQDAFGTRWTTEFRQRSIGDGILHGQFEADEEGNEAH